MSLIFWTLVFHQMMMGHTRPQDSEPKFLAPLQNYTVVEGENVTFTCIIQNLGSHRVEWSSDLASVGTVVRDADEWKISLLEYFTNNGDRAFLTSSVENDVVTTNLTITHVHSCDFDNYTCQIGQFPELKQVGSLKVYFPADISRMCNPNDYLVVEEHSDVRVMCNATGYPLPRVWWERPDGSTGPQVNNSLGLLDIPRVQRIDSGVYVCMAENELGPPASYYFYVNVNFPPTVSPVVETLVVPYSSIPRAVTLECLVEAPANSEIIWMNGHGVISSKPFSKYSITRQKITDYSFLSRLEIQLQDKSDFGVYECLAITTKGQDRGNVTLKETPD